MELRDSDPLPGLRRLRGVEWRWRDDADVSALGLRPGAREGGVLAQDVQAAFPNLVDVGPSGYLRVDYAGLEEVLARAIGVLACRVEALDPSSAPSDRRLKADTDPIADALRRLEDPGGDLSDKDRQALIGLLVEAVKELDSRLTDLERRLRS